MCVATRALRARETSIAPVGFVIGAAGLRNPEWGTVMLPSPVQRSLAAMRERYFRYHQRGKGVCGDADFP